MADQLVDLVEAVQQKRQRIAELERELEALRSELNNVRELLLHDAPPAPAPQQPSLKLGKGGSSVQWTLAVLRDVGEPLHVNEIIERIQHRFGQRVRYATLVGNLSRMVKENKTFFRFAPNVFGLREWTDEAEADTRNSPSLIA